MGVHYLQEAERLLALVDQHFAGLAEGDRLIVLAVACGTRTGTHTYPADASAALAGNAAIMSAAAAYARNVIKVMSTVGGHA
jgi:hypothetical protein